MMISCCSSAAELFIDLGVQANRVSVDLPESKFETDTDLGAHLALGARREAGTNSDFGFRVEVDSVNSEMFLAIRALDYRYRLNETIAVSGFFGGARYDLATPAYGYYAGIGLQWIDIFPGWDANIDYRYAEKVARDSLVSGDPPPVNTRNDFFYDIESISIYFSYKF